MIYFYIVNIFSRSGGYSFLCKSTECLTDKQVIDRCGDKRLFDEQRDARDAYVDAFPMTEDIVRYKKAYDI
jgi:hypothetical protein